jgi:hypothetical protein
LYGGGIPYPLAAGEVSRLYIHLPALHDGTLVRFFLVRNSKFAAPLCPAPLQYQSASAGCHARTKPEFSVAFHPTRLVCPFHCTNSSLGARTEPSLRFKAWRLI